MEPYESLILPRKRRPGKPRGGVMQIRLTSYCDCACPHCTQLCDWRAVGRGTLMHVEQFEQAVISLKDYWGIIGIFGGNPCLHPKFTEICKILRKYFPKERCGLWSNRIYDYGPICAETFNPSISNLNVHGSKEAYKEIREGWPQARPFGLKEPSRHPPILTAVMDLVPEEKMWDVIKSCDLNKHWSAMIAVINGQLRGFFCEVAGSLATLHSSDPDWPDLGVEIEPGWWKKGWEAFADQARFYCPRCGVPLRGWGALDRDESAPNLVSKCHYEFVCQKGSRRSSPIKLITNIKQLGGTDLQVIIFIYRRNVTSWHCFKCAK